jgi:spore photoproduct lyase
VTYMSMGSLRFPPALKDVVRERFPKSRLLYAELFPGADGKMRYFKPLRTEMYAKMLAWIRRYTVDTGLYLCMESQEIWQKVFGHAPTCSTEVEQHIQGAELRSGRTLTQVVPLSSLRPSPRAAL